MDNIINLLAYRFFNINPLLFLAEDYSCSNPNVLRGLSILATALTWLKTLIPLILVISSTIALAKAILSNDDVDVRKCSRSLITKFIIGLFVFFLPTIVSAVMGNIDTYNKSTWKDCVICVIDTKKCNKNMTQQGLVCKPGLLGDPKYINAKTGDRYPAYYLDIAFTIIKYSGVIICVVTTTIEVFETILNQSDDGYKKVVSHTLKRLCYAAVLFFIPGLVDAIMKLVGLSGCTFGIQ